MAWELLCKLEGQMGPACVLDLDDRHAGDMEVSGGIDRARRLMILQARPVTGSVASAQNLLAAFNTAKLILIRIVSVILHCLLSEKTRAAFAPPVLATLPAETDAKEV